MNRGLGNIPLGVPKVGGGSLALRTVGEFIITFSHENFIECSRRFHVFHGLPSHSMGFYRINFHDFHNFPKCSVTFHNVP